LEKGKPEEGAGEMRGYSAAGKKEIKTSAEESQKGWAFEGRSDLA